MKGGWVQAEDLYVITIFFLKKNRQKYPGKPLKFGRKSPGKPWKRSSFYCWPPCLLMASLKRRDETPPNSLPRHVADVKMNVLHFGCTDYSLFCSYPSSFVHSLIVSSFIYKACTCDLIQSHFDMFLWRCR